MTKVMKSYLAFLLLIGWSFDICPQTAVQKSAVVNGNGSSSLAFQAGEKLTYKVYYNWNFVWLAAGEVTFEISENDRYYHFKAIGRTYESYEWFYYVRDVYHSWADKNTLLPQYSERSIHEGEYRIYERIQYDQNARKAVVWRAPKQGEPETRTEHHVQDYVFDVLSSIYFLRTLDLSNKPAGTEYPFRIFMDQEEFPLRLRYLGKEDNKKIRGLGRFRTLKVQPQVIVGHIFTEDSKMTVWVSDDENRLPLLIETPIAVGSVKMILKEHKGLKYPLHAKRE
ncbi:MAG: DUF3108 domain-containing protein [Saprospiraceae bacterium]|nr:DUF3108 domain-containing protein [Saprospiraceae bacterium]MDW8485008.1 DUF3108 domain-containing protein [Saprospiraceae bacterium]